MYDLPKQGKTSGILYIFHVGSVNTNNVEKNITVIKT
jgi:hypothetical protein